MITLPILPYAYNALEPFIDAQTMHLHHEKHHATYIKNLNDALANHSALQEKTAEELISNLSEIPEAIRTKVRNNAGGHVNHSFFWQIMAPAQSTKIEGEVMKAISESFGSLDALKEQFEKAALGRFGSGWVWVVSERGKLIITDTPNQDSPWMEGKAPILGLDVWEHAYYLNYQNRRIDYIRAWWNVINWIEVDRRFLDTLA